MVPSDHLSPAELDRYYTGIVQVKKMLWEMSDYWK